MTGHNAPLLSASKLSAFVKSLIHDYHYYDKLGRQVHHHDGVENRRETRHVVAMPVLVQPLDLETQPVGESFVAMTRNLSNGGMGLIFPPGKPSAKFLRVDFSMPTAGRASAVVEVLHDSHGAVRIVGGKFVTDG